MDTYFYNANGKMLRYRIGKYFDRGGNADIYRINNSTCLKWFTEDVFYNEIVFKTIAKMHLNGFYNIYDMLYDDNNKFVGYTMQYYQKEDIDILRMPVEYTLDNLYKLYLSIQKLNKIGIAIHDLHDGNVILGINDITVIDIDMYNFYDKTSKRTIEYMNLSSLNTLFKYLYDVALENNNMYDEDYRNIVYDLFKNDANIDDVHHILSRYKYPIDYIRDKKVHR